MSRRRSRGLGVCVGQAVGAACVTKGAGSKKAALAMAYKLLDAAQERWRRFNGHELVADVLAGVKFKDGIRVTDNTNHDDEMTDERVAA